MKSGVYQIVNTVSGKVYVGSAVDFDARWRVHRSELRNNKHANSHLQSSYNKHGESAFVYAIVEHCPPDSMIDREQQWIDASGVVKTGYNICPSARNMLGFRHSEEARKKMSARTKGQRRSPKTEFKKGIVPWNKGTVGATGGWKQTDEARAKISAAHKGKTISEDAKRKMRLAKLGKKQSPEHVQKVADAQKKYITFRGETMCIKDWAKRVGVSSETMGYRLKNWDIERAITTPLNPNMVRHGK